MSTRFRDLSAIPAPEATETPPEDLVEMIAGLVERLGPFESVPWRLVAEQVGIERSNQLALLAGAGALTTDQIREIRGRVQALGWLLGLPDTIRTDIATLQSQLDEFTEQGDADA